MRRKDREITDARGIEEILRQCKTCHVAMADGGAPYVVPLSYGYRFVGGGALELYFHSAPEGRKIDAIKRNSNVCFEMSYEGEPIRPEDPCGSGYCYASVIGFGNAAFIEDIGEKCVALSAIFKHQTGKDARFAAEQANNVCVFKIAATGYTGKKKPLPNS